MNPLNKPRPLAPPPPLEVPVFEDEVKPAEAEAPPAEAPVAKKVFTRYAEHSREATKSDRVFHQIFYKIGYGASLIVDQIRVLFNKLFFKDRPKGFNADDVRTWIPSEKLRYLKVTELNPFQLAKLLGFTKSAIEVSEELDHVPSRVVNGNLVKGVEEGEENAFKKSLGLETLSPDTPTPFTDAFSMKAGYYDRLSVGAHSMLVVRMFDQHLAKRFQKHGQFEKVVSLNAFRVFLMLRDVGKGLAIHEQGMINTAKRKKRELEYSFNVMRTMTEKGVFSPDEEHLFISLMNNKILDQFLSGSLTIAEAAKQLKERKRHIQPAMTNKQFFSLLKLFHAAENGANKLTRQVDGMFELEEGTQQIRHDKASGLAQFKRAGYRLKELYTEFNAP